MFTRRVELPSVNIGRVGKTFFVVDILSGSLAPPQVTLAANNRYPRIRDFYAEGKRVKGGIGSFKCVRLTVFFESPITSDAVGLAVNISQEGATELTFPWFSILDDYSSPDLELEGLDSDSAFAGIPGTDC